MNKINNLPKSVPETVSTFQLDVLGKLTNTRFIGDFTCKIPTIKDQCMIAKHKAMLDGEMANHLPVATLRTHQMISYLRYTITDAPKFWKDSDLGYELRDPNVIKAVYDQVLELEEKWMKALWGDGKDETEDDGTARASEEG